MKRIIIATNNAGKVKEIKSIFSGIYDEVLSLKDAGIKIDVVEDGTTFEENAAKKAVEVSKIVDCDCLADDSGLCVDGLNGAPGVFSARYSPEGTDAANKAALIKAVSEIPESERTARFMCSIVIANGGKVKLTKTASSDTGIILTEERGENGFGYDPLFYLPERKLTYAEMLSEEKNAISHRARALNMIKEALQ